uniref:Transducer of regulated CREB activity N-terminal domain-containing protein n=1 Tax=Photinus pyralis TaxID=7054 RepID=A0A1Y1L993_PHOPY
MANPRKFSEKIALHTHRQAEETARFEQIMKEVSDATARPEDPIQMKIQYNREGRSSRPQGGPMRRPPDRKHDTSPYSISPFLSPPSDTGWRRTNSDSALHQSAMQGGMGGERKENSSSRWMLQTLNGPEQHDGRPRSCEVPRVPGINIYPSAHEPVFIFHHLFIPLLTKIRTRVVHLTALVLSIQVHHRRYHQLVFQQVSGNSKGAFRFQVLQSHIIKIICQFQLILGIFIIIRV